MRETINQISPLIPVSKLQAWFLISIGISHYKAHLWKSIFSAYLQPATRPFWLSRSWSNREIVSVIGRRVISRHFGRADWSRSNLFIHKPAEKLAIYKWPLFLFALVSRVLTPLAAEDTMWAYLSTPLTIKRCLWIFKFFRNTKVEFSLVSW